MCFWGSLLESLQSASKVNTFGDRQKALFLLWRGICLEIWHIWILQWKPWGFFACVEIFPSIYAMGPLMHFLLTGNVFLCESKEPTWNSLPRCPRPIRQEAWQVFFRDDWMFGALFTQCSFGHAGVETISTWVGASSSEDREKLPATWWRTITGPSFSEAWSSWPNVYWDHQARQAAEPMRTHDGRCSWPSL